MSGECAAVAIGQQYTCYECGLTWDLNDKDVQCGKRMLTKEEIRENLTELSKKMGANPM